MVESLLLSQVCPLSVGVGVGGGRGPLEGGIDYDVLDLNSRQNVQRGHQRRKAGEDEKDRQQQREAGKSGRLWGEKGQEGKGRGKEMGEASLQTEKRKKEKEKLYEVQT